MGLLNAKSNNGISMPGKKKPKMTKKPLKVEKPKMAENEEIQENIENENIEESVEIAKNQDLKENAKIDVNADQKIDLSMGENDEDEKISENENSEEKSPTDKDSAETDEDNKVEAEPKKKSTRKRKTTKKKVEETVKEINTDVETITDVNEATEYLEDIINFTSEEWEEEEKDLRDKLVSLAVRPDLNPDDVKKLIGELSTAYTDIKGRLVDVEKSANSLEKQIKDIKTLNSVGSNATERNLNATKAVMFFKKNPEDEKAVDLEQYLLMLKHKVNFYKYCIDTMGYNRQLLITFASVFKIEINNM
jgi:hypothetical protein